MRQLQAQHRGLKRVKAEVPVDYLGVVLLVGSMRAKPPQRCREDVVLRGDQAVVAGVERSEPALDAGTAAWPVCLAAAGEVLTMSQ